LVKILELILIEKYVPVSASRQWLGRPIKEREAMRYNERTAAERCNGRLKDGFGGRCVQVRGTDKVMMHLMFGIIALFADQLLKVTVADCR
jgi:hypothetical protein